MQGLDHVQSHLATEKVLNDNASILLDWHNWHNIHTVWAEENGIKKKVEHIILIGITNIQTGLLLYKLQGI